MSENLALVCEINRRQKKNLIKSRSVREKTGLMEKNGVAPQKKS